MGIITGLLERRTTLVNPAQWLIDWFSGGGASAAGVTVNETTALNVTTVYACVRILAETVASLPLHVYRRLPSGGKERATDHYLYSLLHDQPNPEMTSLELREAQMGHLALWGNAFAEIERDNAGRAIALWPLRPDRMMVRRVNGALTYEYQLPDGAKAALAPDQILHLRGLSPDGIVGYSPIRLAREAIGLAIATEEFGAKFFGSGAHPGGIVEFEGRLDDQQLARYRKSVQDAYGGLGKAHRLMVLEQGLKYTQVGIPPDDAQFLETRRFQVEEIARFFRIPPHMLADLERATFSNIEHQSIEFVVHTVRPWLVRWEQGIRRSLFPPQERATYFAEFLVDGLLRGDIKSRYEAYAIARQNGWMSANDIRLLENQNPITAGGDIYLVPLNMVPADSVAAPQGPSNSTGGAMQRSALPSEERAARAATSRRRLARQFERLFRSVEERIVKREAADVRQAVQRFLGRRDSGQFLAWLEQFYGQHQEFMLRSRLPAYLTYADAVQAAAAEEIAAAAEMTTTLQDFVRAYLVSHGALHAASAAGQLRQLVDDALAAGDDPAPWVEGRLQEWEQKRPDKTAQRETVQAGNAVAREVYMAAGIRKLRWHAFGANCPYCSALNGRTVGIDSTFLAAGDSLQPDGADHPLTTTVDVRHPPGHDGCDCQITASL